MPENQNNMQILNGSGEKVEMRLPEEPTEETHSHVGAILGVIIIMLVVLLGAFYIWGGLLKEQAKVVPVETPIVNNEPETPRADADTQILETLSTSDEITAIDADLESTNIDSIDTDLSTIDAEFDAALAE